MLLSQWLLSMLLNTVTDRIHPSRIGSANPQCLHYYTAFAAYLCRGPRKVMSPRGEIFAEEVQKTSAKFRGLRLGLTLLGPLQYSARRSPGRFFQILVCSAKFPRGPSGPEGPFGLKRPCGPGGPSWKSLQNKPGFGRNNLDFSKYLGLCSGGGSGRKWARPSAPALSPPNPQQPEPRVLPHYWQPEHPHQDCWNLKDRDLPSSRKQTQLGGTTTTACSRICDPRKLRYGY